MFKYLLNFIHMGILPACMPVYHPCASALGGQERVSEPLDLESQTIASYHVEAKT